MNDQINYVGDKGDDFLDVTFYKGYVGDVETDFIRIVIPGDKTNVVDEVVSEDDKKRFQRKWLAYEGMQNIAGTLVADWPELPEGLRSEFIYQGFKYIEQIAGAPDSAFTRIMGGVHWRIKAQAFLNSGKRAEAETIAEQAGKIQELEEKMQLLIDRIDAVKPCKKARPVETVDEV